MKQRQRGAAILMAMLVVTLGTLLVSGAALRQSVLVREVKNEAAVMQARALMGGAVDWVRLILREDARVSSTDHLAEPWAVPLARTRIDAMGERAAQLSGRIEDAQARFNLRNVVGAAGVVPVEVATLGRLLALAGERTVTAGQLAQRITAAYAVAPGGTAALPATIDDIATGSDAERTALERLRPFVILLPVATPVNANTASAEVLAARFDNLALADAQRLVASRDRTAFRDFNDVIGRLPGVEPTGGIGQITGSSSFFLLRGLIEFERARVEATVLLRREGARVDVVWSREA